MSAELRKVLIIGGGFAGLNAAKKLGNKAGISVTVVDKKNHHLFQPLLYQVATAGLSPAEIASPIRSVLSDYSNVEVFCDEITAVVLSNRTAKSTNETYKFDYLVIACGASHSYFGHEDWEDFAPGLKTLEQATEIRRRILSAFEEAEKEHDLEKQRADLSFVVVGGGPTGVELAGSIAELSRVTLAKDFRNIDPSRTRIFLVEAGPRLLASFNESLARKALRSLEELGVQVWLQSRVTKINSDGVQVGKDFIASRCVIWAAGVKPNQIAELLPLEKDQLGRIKVKSDLSVEGFANVFVAGDLASFNQDGATLPGLAPVANQQGILVGKNILADVKSRPRKDFRYFDKGMMATIGRKRAVLQTKKIKVSGFLAWLAWLLVHIYFLIGFRNRLAVFLQWAWAYFTYNRGARLIVSKDWREAK